MTYGTHHMQRPVAAAGAAPAYRVRPAVWSIGTGVASPATAVAPKPATNPVVKGDFIDLTHHRRPEEAPL